jgi:hypothetical protein
MGTELFSSLVLCLQLLNSGSDYVMKLVAVNLLIWHLYYPVHCKIQPKIRYITNKFDAILPAMVAQ